MNNDTNKFDLRQFNKEFIKRREDSQPKNKIKSQKKLDNLIKRETTEDPPLYQQSIGEMMIGIKDTWFNILDDILTRKVSGDLFTKENRLFYIGLTIIIVAILLYVYNFFVEDDTTNNKVIIEKHFIYNEKTGQTVEKQQPIISNENIL